jgi:hypothetical protein
MGRKGKIKLRTISEHPDSYHSLESQEKRKNSKQRWRASRIQTGTAPGHYSIGRTPPVFPGPGQKHTFGSSGITDLETMYSRGSLTGSVTNNTEVGIRLTHFFDYATSSAAGTVPQDVTNFWWEAYQNLFNDRSGDIQQGTTFCRVRKVHVWVLPNSGVSTLQDPTSAPQNASRVMSVNVQTPGSLSGSPATAVATNTQVTNVLPQVDTRWKKVFTCDLQRTFQSGTVRPFFGFNTVNTTAQCLFQMQILNPDTGVPYLSQDATLKVQVKVCLDIDQPVLPVQDAKLTVFRNDDFRQPGVAFDGDPFEVTTEQYVQMKITGARNYFA